MEDNGSVQPPLADYDKPPVVETVLGVQFAPLMGWDVRHFGIFWERVKDRFPHLDTKPALARPGGGGDSVPFDFIIEQLGDPAAGIRCWFIDEDKTRLLQVQQDRFIHNWRKVTGEEQYPRYERDVRPRFAAEFDELLLFLASQGIPKPKFRSCEVTYINHLVKGHEGETLYDLPRIFPAFGSGEFAGAEFSAPDSINLSWRHRLEDASGWLTFALKSATRSRDDKKVLQYQISAQVDLAEQLEQSAVLDALDLGRSAVVRSFHTSTSDAMHDLWQQKGRVS